MRVKNVWPQTIGPTAPVEAFYYDCRPRDAYKKYAHMLITRKNTITGLLYKDDPAIFACGPPPSALRFPFVFFPFSL